jgi:predicted DsbA family dithiol-disulfide isomerase
MAPHYPEEMIATIGFLSMEKLEFIRNKSDLFMKIFRPTKENGFPSALFIIVSLLNLVLLTGVFIAFSVISERHSLVENEQRTKKTLSEGERLKGVDPFITRGPGANNALSGPIIRKNDPILGPEDAPVTIVEFADFKCDICQKQNQVLKRVQEEYGDKIRVIWKDYPSYEKNSPSFKAARAGRCAWRQDGFWSYADLLYENNDKEQNDQLFISLAGDAGLNVYDFRSCLQERRVDDLIMNNIVEASNLGIPGIPFLYVNEQEVMGEAGYEEVKRLVGIELGL